MTAEEYRAVQVARPDLKLPVYHELSAGALLLLERHSAADICALRTSHILSGVRDHFDFSYIHYYDDGYSGYDNDAE